MSVQLDEPFFFRKLVFGNVFKLDLAGDELVELQSILCEHLSVF